MAVIVIATAQSRASGVCILSADWRKGVDVNAQSRTIENAIEIQIHGLEKKGMAKKERVAERDWRRFAIWVRASVV